MVVVVDIIHSIQKENYRKNKEAIMEWLWKPEGEIEQSATNMVYVYMKIREVL